MKRGDWLEGVLMGDASRQMKRAAIELAPLIGTGEVSLCTVEELRERLEREEGGVHVCVIWGSGAIDTESDP